MTAEVLKTNEHAIGSTVAIWGERRHGLSK